MAGVTSTVCFSPFREYTMLTGLPPVLDTISRSLGVERTGWPLALTMMSPDFRPAWAAGLPGNSLAISMSFSSPHPANPVPVLGSSAGVTVTSWRSPLRLIQTLRGWPALAASFIAISSQVGSAEFADLDNTIALMNAGFGGGAVGHHIADHRRRRGGDLGESHHEQPRKNGHGQQDIHGRPGERNDHALPARLLQEAAGIAGAFIARLLARHLHVAAEQKRGEAEIGFAFFEAEQPRAETEAEGLHLDVEKSRRPVMTELMDQDHDPDQNQKPKEIL